MAVIARVVLIALLAAAAFAQEPESVSSDSLLGDSLLTAVIDTTMKSSAVVSSWLLPLGVIAATAGVFLFLFTARTRN